MSKIISGEVQDENLKILIYGASGTGKTVFASTAPDVLFIDAEAGMLSIREKKIDRIKVETFQDVSDAFKFLIAGEHKYKTVVIDSLTEIQKKSMDDILRLSGHERPTIADWGTNIEQIRKMVRHFRDLPMNVIFIALDMIEKDEITGQTTRLPALQGKTLPQEVMGFVDIVGYLIAEERTNASKEKEKIVVRALRVQPMSSVYAKDRSGLLGSWVEPDYQKIYNCIFPKKEK